MTTGRWTAQLADRDAVPARSGRWAADALTGGPNRREAGRLGRRPVVMPPAPVRAEMPYSPGSVSASAERVDAVFPRIRFCFR